MQSVFIKEGGAVYFGGRLFSRQAFREYLRAMQMQFVEKEVLRENEQKQLERYTEFILYTYLEG